MMQEYNLSRTYVKTFSFFLSFFKGEKGQDGIGLPGPPGPPGQAVYLSSEDVRIFQPFTNYFLFLFWNNVICEAMVLQKLQYFNSKY